MEQFIKNLQKKGVTKLKEMHYHAKGYEKELIESVLIKKMYSK